MRLRQRKLERRRDAARRKEADERRQAQGRTGLRQSRRSVLSKNKRDGFWRATLSQSLTSVYGSVSASALFTLLRDNGKRRSKKRGLGVVRKVVSRHRMVGWAVLPNPAFRFPRCGLLQISLSFLDVLRCKPSWILEFKIPVLCYI